MALAQQRRVVLFLIFMAFLLSLHLDQVSFTNNYISFIDKQYISVNRDQFSNNLVLPSAENKSKAKMAEFEFPIGENIEERGGNRWFEGTKVDLRPSTKIITDKAGKSTSDAKHFRVYTALLLRAMH